MSDEFTLVVDETAITLAVDRGPQGEEGEPGTGFNPMPEWSSVTGYTVNDVAPRNGSLYLALTDNLNAPPESSPTDWRLWVSKGNPGATWYTGSGAPGGGLGVDGDLYFRTLNAEVSVKAAGSWTVIADLTGNPGTNGFTWYTGSTAPSGGTGVDGDLHFRTSNADVSKKITGAWTIIANLTGLPGTNGTNGFTWYTGSTAPSGGTGVDGDLHFRTSNAEVSKKIAGAWTIIANLTGLPGTNGTNGFTWYTGSTAPSGGTGVDGDLHFRTSNADVSKKIAGAWTVIANITGLPGTDGTDGKNVLSGTGAPAGGQGVDGEFYIRIDTWQLYGPKTSGAWGSPTNIIGPPGGARLFGSGAPSSGLGSDNDVYEDTATGDEYQKVSGTWTLRQNLRGPPGAKDELAFYLRYS